MNAAIIGGTFNPIHIGHLNLALEVLNQFKYDKIIFIPANIPPHKTISNSIETKHRYKMAEIAAKENMAFTVDKCEIERGGISYTIDTIEYVCNKYKIKKAGYILGDDLISEFHTWKNAKKLSETAELIVAHRKFKDKLKFDYRHTYVDNLILPISSSDIRNRIISGKPVRYLLTKDVLNYINKNNLYKKT